MKRNYSIDILKGICIIFVVTTHYYWSAAERLKFLFPFWIGMAVPIFMIISGYVHTNSFERHQIDSFEKAYDFSFIMNKLSRYTIPFAIIYLIEIILDCMLSQNPSIFEIAIGFLRGGKGPGSYYFPIFIQFVFLFPVLYFIIKKYNFFGLVLCGTINFIYELLQSAYNMSGSLYRLLVFRYILVIAFGCYLSLKKEKLKKSIGILSFVCGTMFIILIAYTDYSPYIITYWKRTSLFACLYVLPIAAFLIEHLTIRCKPLEFLGKASYNILLVQILYYRYLDHYIYSLIDKRIMELAISLVICLLGGICFYFIETPITKLLVKKLNTYLLTLKSRDLPKFLNNYIYSK